MCNCDDCEQWMQPYMDRVLTDAERLEAQEHLDECAYCRKRYRFEEELRQFVRQAVVELVGTGSPASSRASRLSIPSAVAYRSVPSSASSGDAKRYTRPSSSHRASS